jgi:hypothetical protein
MKIAENNGLRFEIVKDSPDVGYYLYVYDEERCIADYLQQDEDTCKQLALEEYGVEPTSWMDKPED